MGDDVSNDTSALQVGGIWYAVPAFASGHALADDFKQHLEDQTPAVYELGGRLFQKATDVDPPPQPTHLVLDRNGAMIPLGVLTHGQMP